MAKVKNVYPLGIEDVYNMEVENHHNYSVNGGFILHNCDSLRYFCASRMITAAAQPEKERNYNFDFERPKSDSNYFGVIDESYLNYGG